MTNRKHEVVGLNDIGRHVVRFLDGNCDKGAIVRKLLQLVDKEVLVIQHEGKPVTDSIQARTILEESLQKTLENLALQALLIQ